MYCLKAFCGCAVAIPCFLMTKAHVCAWLSGLVAWCICTPPGVFLHWGHAGTAAVGSCGSCKPPCLWNKLLTLDRSWRHQPWWLPVYNSPGPLQDGLLREAGGKKQLEPPVQPGAAPWAPQNKHLSHLLPSRTCGHKSDVSLVLPLPRTLFFVLISVADTSDMFNFVVIWYPDPHFSCISDGLGKTSFLLFWLRTS